MLATFSATDFSASRSKRSARASRFSARVNSCITPTLVMVMKSRVRLNASGPLIGKLLTPTVATGSGSCPAATAISRDAVIAESCATSWRERSTARCWAFVNVSGACAKALVAKKAPHIVANLIAREPMASVCL